MLPESYSIQRNHQNKVVFAVYKGYHPEPYVVWKMQEDVLYDGKYFSDAKEAIDYFNEITHPPCQSKPVDIAEEKIDIEGDTLGERLRFLRKSKGLTQKELASQSGISYGAIASYEKGLRKPNYKSLILFEDFYNIKASDLIGKEELIKKDNSETSLSKLPFHIKIKELRKRKEYTQEELAEKIGIGYSTLRSYEDGSREPSANNLIKLANIFDYPADKLIADAVESKLVIYGNCETDLSNLPFHLKLKELRKQSRYTQEELSKKTGIGYQAIVNYEIGRRKPTGDNLIKLAKVLDYPADKLIADPPANKGEKAK